MKQKQKVKGPSGVTVGATGKSVGSDASSAEAALRAMAITFIAPEARAVSIVGDFNDWRVARDPLEMTDGQNWHITLQLKPGTYQYKFFIDGNRWEEDPQNPKRVVNEFGTSNSILEVP